MESYLVIVEKINDSYSAYIPDIPGCVSTGKTIYETLSNMQEALEFHVSGLIKEGYRVPEPITEAHYVRVDVDE